MGQGACRRQEDIVLLHSYCIMKLWSGLSGWPAFVGSYFKFMSLGGSKGPICINHMPRAPVK